MKYLRWFLFPFSLLYGLVVIIRNWFYDAGVFKSQKFDLPVISVGNLEVGGAGKSPMTEYLIRLLKDNHKLATLSRGYGRKTKGYVVASAMPTVPRVPTVSGAPTETPGTITEQIGDEPAQFKSKFPDITVAVSENRVEGIKQLLPHHDLILMDDAFQHRAVEAGLSILLFDYSKLNDPHLLLPAGNMREPFSGRWRAQILVASKCPPQLNVNAQAVIAEKLKPLPYQQLFFSSIAYQSLQDMDGRPIGTKIDKETTVFLITGIANAGPLVNYLSSLTPIVIHHNYPDHHPFTLKNITKLAAEYEGCISSKKIIVTTEKDAQRLEVSWFKMGSSSYQIPVFVIPITVRFLDGSGDRFDQLIIDYVREYTAHHSIY